jgi:hypothetical protein
MPAISLEDGGQAQGGVEEHSSQAFIPSWESRNAFLSILEKIRAEKALRDSLKAQSLQSSDQVDCGDFVDSFDDEIDIEEYAENISTRNYTILSASGMCSFRHTA